MSRVPPTPQLTRHVLELCARAGFERAGIASVEVSAYARELHEWLAAGKQGSMAWLGEHLHVRTDPGRLLRGSRAIVMVASRYSPRGHADGPTPVGRGRIARYARGRDYHRAMKKRLHAICDRLREEFPGHECRAFADIEPMPERELAARAGIGWVGKHSLIIEPRLGSWLVLGGFSTTLPLEAPAEQAVVTDHCGTCTRCIEACPTRAITPYSVDASRCIAYLTIERRLPIPVEHHARIGDWLFGCDVCQEVCPHNSPRPGRGGGEGGGDEIRGQGASSTGAVGGEDGASLGLVGVLGWSASDRSAALSGSVIKRATLEMLKRNAVIVLGNQLARGGGKEIRACLEAVAGREAESRLVRETAALVLDRVGGGRGGPF